MSFKSFLEVAEIWKSLNFPTTVEDFVGRNLGSCVFGFKMKISASETVRIWNPQGNGATENRHTAVEGRISREKPELLSLEFFWQSLVKEGKRRK